MQLILNIQLKNFENFSKEEIYDHRKNKFLQIGRDRGFAQSAGLDEGGLSYKETGLSKLKFHIDKNKYVYAGIGAVVFAGLMVLLT